MFVGIKNIKAMFFSQFFNLQLLVQSVPITTKIVSLHPIHGEVYSMQHYDTTVMDIEILMQHDF
jgi:hypothetical protein